MPDARRQLGQYKRLIREEQQVLRWIWLFWAVPSALVLLSFYFDWHWVAKVACGWAVVTGAISQADSKAKIWNYRKKIDELEQVSRF